MVDLGMTPAAALRAATASRPTLLGLERRLGTLEAGKASRHRRRARRPARRHHGHGAGRVRDEGRRGVPQRRLTRKLSQGGSTPGENAADRHFINASGGDQA